MAIFKSFKDKLKNLFRKEEDEQETAEENKEKIEHLAEEIIEEAEEEQEEKEIEEAEEKQIEEQIKVPKETAGVLDKEKEITLKKDFSPATQKFEPNLAETKKQIEEEIEKVEPETKIPEKEEKQKIFSKLKGKFTGNIILTQKEFDEFFEKLEMLLLENNVALEVVDKIRQDLEKELINTEIKKQNLEDKIKETLRKSIEEILLEPYDIIDKINEKKDKPFTILFFGINGSGKTTTISKIANLLQKNKITNVLAAGDTFRAASIEQLKKHGDKLGIKVIHQTYGADPAAVGFDAIQHAKAHKLDVVLIDTAGRMHTKQDLIREMEKIIKVTNPDLKIFVAESITGNDATEQAKKFDEAFGIDGTILTKADVDEKGGTAISIGHITKKPILFLGTGQKYKDLEKFEPKEILIGLGLD